MKLACAIIKEEIHIMLYESIIYAYSIQFTVLHICTF